MTASRKHRKPWNNWFHCIATTYGAWLRGDPRGWRSRKHNIHVPYDYKNPPPPGTYDRFHAYNKFIMNRDTVILSREEQSIVCQKFIEALTFHNVEVINLCVSPTHTHVLCRFVHPSPGIAIPGPSRAPALPNPSASKIREPRHLIGIAKKESARALSKSGLRSKGGIWAVRCKAKPIRNRRHQIRAARYILAHYKRGAIIWPPIQTSPR